jgi:hypothetical protein
MDDQIDFLKNDFGSKLAANTDCFDGDTLTHGFS